MPDVDVTPELTSLVSDAFERTVPTGLGTADVGGAWLVNQPGRAKVDGHDAVLAMTAARQDTRALCGPAAADVDILALIRLNATDPKGGSYAARTVARAQDDARNGYVARLTHLPDGSVSWGLGRIDLAGLGRNLAGGKLLNSGGAGTNWWLRLFAQGTTLKLRIWADGSPEPADWKTTAVDAYWQAGRVALGAVTNQGATSPYPTVRFASITAAAVPLQPPDPPSLSAASAIGKVNLQWTTPPAGGAPISGYKIYRSQSGAAETMLATVPLVNSYADTTARAGNAYAYTVTALNGAGESAHSAAATAAAATGAAAIYWGAYMDGNQTYQRLYGGTWGDAPWDANTWSTFEAHSGKRAAIVQWGVRAPWNYDFNHFNAAFTKTRAAGELPLVAVNTMATPLADIAAGRYDNAIRTWMQQAAAWAHPFLLIFDVEMNGPWEPYAPGNNGNTAQDYVDAFRHFHALAQQAGATNISWVWCPNVDPNGNYTPYSELYPGDDVVDWTGLDGFNRGGASWRSFADIFGSSYQDLVALAPAKPILISQVGCTEDNGSKADWLNQMFAALPSDFPMIRALVWFNWWFREPTGVWCGYEIESSPEAQQAWRNGIASGYFLAGGGFANLPAGQPVPIPTGQA